MKTCSDKRYVKFGCCSDLVLLRTLVVMWGTQYKVTSVQDLLVVNIFVPFKADPFEIYYSCIVFFSL